MRESVWGTSFSGGPPVPRMREGSWVRRGGAMSDARSSAGGVVVRLSGSVIWELSLGVDEVRGIMSLSFPISSARSVMARLDEPRRSWRPRTKYAVAAKTTKKPITGRLGGRLNGMRRAYERRQLFSLLLCHRLGDLGGGGRSCLLSGTRT